jgi:hypothetical protein
MSDANMNEQLRKWGFRPIGSDGRPKSDEAPQTPQKTPAEKPVGGAMREIARQILDTSDVKI